MNLNKEDLTWCVKRLPNDVKKAMMQEGTKLSVGGGFIRSCITGDKTCDIDMFVDSENTAKRVVGILLKDNVKPFKTKNAHTLFRNGKPNVQIITRWLYEKPVDVLSDLDFSVCCAVIWFDISNNEWVGKCVEPFYMDLAARRLRYMTPNRNEDAGGSILRVLKYYGKGYKVTLDSYAKVIARLAIGVDMELIRGSEDKLAFVLKGLLYEVDPQSVHEDPSLLGAVTLEDQEESENG